MNAERLYEIANYYNFVSERDRCTGILAKLQGIYDESYPLELFKAHYRRTAETYLLNIKLMKGGRYEQRV